MSDASEIARGPGEMMGNAGPGMLAGLRVIEVADERAEYTGLLLAGLGAEVVKVEPPEGNATRRIGPFLEDEPSLERSLFFWNYNRNKKSVVLDLRETLAREHMLRLLEGADVLLAWDFLTPVLAEAWPSADRLRWVHTASAGVDNVLTPEVAASDIVVTNSRGVFDGSLSEYVLGLVLAFAKDLPGTWDRQRRREWQHRDTERVAGTTAVIVGVGPVGRATARLLRAVTSNPPSEFSAPGALSARS